MFVDTAVIAQFILAGKSFFTVKNTETGGRFTFKVVRLTDNEGKVDENQKLWFVSVLTGPDNSSNYDYLGIIREGFGDDGKFHRTGKSRITADAPSHKAFSWLFNTTKAHDFLPSKVEFHHAGRCGRCGRKLTTPESVETGYGPVCMGLL